jgi:hypothetical protein
MMTATKQITVDRSKCEQTAEELYRSGMKYLSVLDQWIESRQATEGNGELAASRERVRTMETFLHRLFPDEFADTSSAAE